MCIRKLVVCAVIVGMILFLAVPAMVFPLVAKAAMGPTVTGIAPNQGSNGSIVNTTVGGTGFVSGATVKLYRAGSSNQVLNPGFEDGFNNWVTSGAVMTVSWGHSGAYSALAGVTGLPGSFESADFISINPAIPGTLTAWLSGYIGISSPYSMGAQCYNNNGDFIDTVPWSGKTTTSSWEQVGGEITSWPANTAKIKVRMAFGFGGQGFLADDVNFTQALAPIEIPAKVNVVSPEKITCDFDLTTPVPLGLYDVVVTNPDAQSGTLANGFTVNAKAPPPSVTSITPNQGNNGSTVYITDLAGTGFVTGATVKLYRAGSSGENQVLNPGFENYVVVGGGPRAVFDNWTPSRYPETAPYVHGGLVSVRFDYFSSYIESADFININPAIPGNLTAWFMPKREADVYTLEARCYDSGGIYLSSVEWTSSGISYEWHEIGGAISWPANTAKIKVKLAVYTQDNGFCWADDVSFTQDPVPPIEIPATNVNVVSPTKITCDFNLTTPVPLGLYDVVVTNPDAQSGILANGFTVTAAINQYTLTPGAGLHGTIDPGTPQTVYFGGSKTFNFTPALGYHIANVKVDNVSIGHPTSYEFTNVISNHVINVTFAINQYTIIANAGPHGTVSPTTQKVNYGSNSTIKITPENGYKISSITDNGVSKSVTNTYVINNVTTNHTIAVSFTANPTPPTDLSTWYLAEGTTAWGFSTYISIENPNVTVTHAKITYMTNTGNVSGGTITLPAQSQTTVNPIDTLGSKDFSTKITCKEGLPIAVDRTMEWTGPGASFPEGHSSIGVNAPSKTWYLPEGSSKWGFECWLLIQNPNSSTANCTITYMIEGEGPKTVSKNVPANTRQTFNIADDIGQKDASIKVESDQLIIPERAMYRNNRREGHDSIGVTTPAENYYLAEGTTAWGFTTYVLVQNSNNVPTDITITYMTPTGPKPQATFTMSPNSRKTIRVNDVVGMENTDFSTQIHGTKPVIAERSMYWGADTSLGEACHDSVGMNSAHTSFYLPDGQTSEGRETWTLVQNPNSSSVMVEISYMTPTGTGSVVFTDTIPPNSRKTYNMADKISSGRAAIVVTSKTSGKKIMCERAMYWNNRGAGTDTIGGYSD